MKLVSFGDSFVEGLIKKPIENSIEERKIINFVSQLLNLDNPFSTVENFGARGSSNASIAHRVWKRAQEDTRDCFFLICWSSPYRYGHYDKHVDNYRTLDLRKEIINEKDQQFETDSFIFFIKSLLESYNIPYAQTNSFATLENRLPVQHYINANYICADQKRHTLFDIIANRFNSNLDLTANDFESNHDMFDVPASDLIALCKHPTDQGHKKIAETLSPFLKKIIDNNAN